MSGTRELRLMVMLMPVAAIAMVAGAAYLAVRTGIVDLGPQQHPDTGRYTEHEGAPQQLLTGFISYQAVVATQTSLESMGLYQWQWSKRHLMADKRYPPRNTDVMIVPEFPYCDTTGALTLEFFNDRLYRASFDPKDLDLCAQALPKLLQGLRPAPNNRAERRSGDLRVATNIDFARTAVGRSLGTSAYVLWQDLRLQRELEEWDDRFGSLPQRLEP